MQETTIQGTLDANRSGDADSSRDFSVVAESLRPRIFQFLLAKMRDMDLAETLTQECFLLAHRNWSKFRGDSQVMTWLTRIAMNLQTDHWRNRRAQFWRNTRKYSVDMREAKEWLPNDECSQEHRMLNRERVTQMWNAVERFSVRQRTVFLLRYKEEQEFAEIARRKSFREGSVKSHLSRTVAKVRRVPGRRKQRYFPTARP
jgi:RNA polymerase sigma-70 factor (ECF subfamily)